MAIPAIPTQGAPWLTWATAVDGAARVAAISVATTVTASGALVAGKHNPVDATGGAKTMTLPTGQPEGTSIGVEKTDASANAVTITGNVRGVGSSTISLPWQNEALLLRADAAGSWWPVAGHKTKASLDANYGGLISVKAYGATGNGTTDDTTAVQAALTAGNGRAYFPAGTYLINATLTAVTNGAIVGDGKGSTVIKLKAGANCDLLKGANFDTLLGTTNPDGGINRFRLEGVTLHGNRANNTSGRGVAIYGHSNVLRDFEIIEFAGTGMIHDWHAGGAQFTPAGDTLETFVSGFVIANNTAGGLVYSGPNDSMVENGVIALNGPAAAKFTGNSGDTTTIGLDAAAGGVLYHNVHVWGRNHKYSIRVSPGGESSQFVECQAEGCTDTNLLILGSSVQWIGGHIYYLFPQTSASINTRLGIQIGDATNGVSGVRILTRATGNEAGVLKLVNNGGHNKFDILNLQTVGTDIIGSTNPTDDYTKLSTYGGATIVNTGTASTVVSGGWVPAHNDLLGASLDPSLANTNTALPAATVIAVKVPLDQPITISNVLCYIGTAGTTLTAGGNWIGIYDSTGTLLGTSADQTTAWGTTGVKTAAITAAGGQSLSVGGAGKFVYVAFLSNGTGPARPQNGGLAVAALTNINTNTDKRVLFGPGGQTTMPSTLSMLSSAHDKLYFAGIT